MRPRAKIGKRGHLLASPLRQPTAQANQRDPCRHARRSPTQSGVSGEVLPPWLCPCARTESEFSVAVHRLRPHVVEAQRSRKGAGQWSLAGQKGHCDKMGLSDSWRFSSFSASPSAPQVGAPASLDAPKAGRSRLYDLKPADPQDLKLSRYLKGSPASKNDTWQVSEKATFCESELLSPSPFPAKEPSKQPRSGNPSR
jgi:hypothetical protein